MDIDALILNCTLKKSPEPSNTQGLIDLVTGHFDQLGVKHETLRPVDYAIPFGVVSDMGEGDEWPRILEKVLAADILIVAMSIWFGVRNSVSQMAIERLDGTYWVGDAGPGPSFIEAGGKDHPYTQKTAQWMAHNVTHLARILKANPIPPEGNTVPGWQPDDCRGHDDRMPGGHVG